MIINQSLFNIHWQTKTLNELGTFRRGKSKHRPRNDIRLFENGKYPFIQTGDVKGANLHIRSHQEAYNDFGLRQSKLWPRNTLCITIAANIAETALLDYPMCFPDSVVGFNAYPDESSEVFMHYVFSYIREAIQKSSSGSIQDNINIDYLTDMQFKIPPKPYQDLMADVLSALDKKIELNNKINSALQGAITDLYNYWFVQFDFPDDSDTPYKSSGGKMVYSSTLKRDIPAAWSDCELSDIAYIVMGQSPPGSSYNEAGNGLAFFQGCTDFGQRFPVKRQYTTQPARLASQGDILLSVRAPVGELNIANEECCIGRGLSALRSKDGSMSYLFEVMRNLKGVFNSRNGDGTTFGAIIKDDLYTLKVVKPSHDLILKYHEITNPMFEQQNAIATENRQLTEIRDWLLPMLMNGQASVRN